MENLRDFVTRDYSLAPKVKAVLPEKFAEFFQARFANNSPAPNLTQSLRVKINTKPWENQMLAAADAPTIKISDFSKYSELALYTRLLGTLTPNKNLRFLDDFFPPSFSSLAPPSKKHTDWSQDFTQPTTINYAAAFQKTYWIRLSDLYKPQKKTLADPATILPTHIAKGHFDDSYISNSLSALCEFPLLVQDIFEGQKFNPQGIYKVR